MHDNLHLGEQFLFPSGFATLPPNAFLAISATPYEDHVLRGICGRRLSPDRKLEASGRSALLERIQTVTETNAFGLQVGSMTIPLFAECADLTTKLDFDSFTPRGGLQYDFNASKNAFFTVSRVSERAASMNPRARTTLTIRRRSLTTSWLSQPMAR